MPTSIVDGLALVDTTGHVILATTLASLLLGVTANLFLRARYASLERDLQENTRPNQPFLHRALNRIVQDAERAVRHSHEVNTQGIIEEAFQSELKPLLLAERFVKSATGLVIILGLLGTFYGLTLSIGRLVHLVSTDTGGVADVSQSVTVGLTQALTGMSVAFSNSLLGIASAVVLTVLSVFSNVTDRRTALMIQIETYLDRRLPARAVASDNSNLEPTIHAFGESVVRLEGVVLRFESALHGFAAETKEFNVRIVASRPRDGR